MENKMNKEYGVTTRETKLCELCGEVGDPGHMARIIDNDEDHYIHDSCGMKMLKAKKEV